MPKDLSDEWLNKRKFQLIRDWWLALPMLTKGMIVGKVDEIIQLSTVQTRTAAQAKATIQN
jgi:hypothetical protein